MFKKCCDIFIPGISAYIDINNHLYLSHYTAYINWYVCMRLESILTCVMDPDSQTTIDKTFKIIKRNYVKFY